MRNQLIDEITGHAFESRGGYIVDMDHVIDAINIYLPATPARGEPMPKTIEHYMCNAIRDQEMILEQKEEIAKMSQTINKLRQHSGYLSGDGK